MASPEPRQVLVAKLRALEAELAVLTRAPTEAGPPVQYGKRAGDHIAESADRMARSTAAEELDRLRMQVEAALRRMDAGVYGTCEVCGAAIPEGRLEALPWAVRCVNCAGRPGPGPRSGQGVGAGR